MSFNFLGLGCCSDKEPPAGLTGEKGFFGADFFDFCGPSKVGGTDMKVLNVDLKVHHEAKSKDGDDGVEEARNGSQELKKSSQRQSQRRSGTPASAASNGNSKHYPRLAGIGIAFETGENIGLIVHSFVPGGSAEAFGSQGIIKAGDELIAVDGVDVRGKKGRDLAQLLIGAEGTKVRVSFVRPCEGSHHRHEITVELLRRVPPQES